LIKFIVEANIREVTVIVNKLKFLPLWEEIKWRNIGRLIDLLLRIRMMGLINHQRILIRIN